MSTTSLPSPVLHQVLRLRARVALVRRRTEELERLLDRLEEDPTHDKQPAKAHAG